MARPDAARNPKNAEPPRPGRPTGEKIAHLGDFHVLPRVAVITALAVPAGWRYGAAGVRER